MSQRGGVLGVVPAAELFVHGEADEGRQGKVGLFRDFFETRLLVRVKTYPYSLRELCFF